MFETELNYYGTKIGLFLKDLYKISAD